MIVNKIVVTGSCGFIGYNFINSLNQISEIVGIDSLNDAYDNNLKKLRLSNLNKLENFKYVQLDFSESSDFESHEYIFENCDALVHLGARAGVRQSFNDPERYLLDNTLGTTNLSLQVKKHSIPKFIIASTSSIYGDTGSKFAVENEDEQFYPPSIYASTKSFGEILAKNILEKSQVNIQIPRFFTVYGPFGRPDMSILRFIHWIYRGEKVILYGDGEQRRSFTYVDDIVDGLLKLLKYNNSGTFNFGSNQTWSLNEVIKMIENNLDKKADIRLEERAYKDVDIVLPDLNSSEEVLNWKPTTTIKDGINKTVNWYLDNKENLKNIEFKYDYEK